MTGNANLFPDVPIKPSTRRTWARCEIRPVITSEDVDLEVYQLLDKVHELTRKVRKQSAIIGLLTNLLNVRGGKLHGDRLPHGDDKTAIVKAIGVAARVIALQRVLRIVGLSSSRYHAWRNRAEGCGLDDLPSCPKLSPNQLTRQEVGAMKEMVESQDYKHVAVQNLALLAQRLGNVFASASTWYAAIREHGWRRPRKRVHPRKPRTGLRATRINQFWQTDASVIRLTTGIRIYVQAIIDNFSRKILAWRVSESLSSETTRELLIEAMQHLPNEPDTPQVFIVTDGGTENMGKVDELLNSESRLHRLIAQADIVFSNSLIEAFWLQLKHAWLFMHTLDSVAGVTRRVKFYVDQHNTTVPRAVLLGRTPDEVYFNLAEDLPGRLVERRRLARQARVATNRAVSCMRCAVQESYRQPKVVQPQPCRVLAAAGP